MIHVKWGRDVLHFPLPPLDTPLGRLRDDLAAYTHLPPDSFKLVYKGAVMKEDDAPLSTYKLKENATIALIGGHVQVPSVSEAPSAPGSAAPRASAAKTAPQTEESAILAIRAELERVRETLVPDVDAFVRALVPSLPRAGAVEPGSPPDALDPRSRLASTTPVPAPTSLDHTRLSELLLQSLLRLDALHVSGADWPDARMERKAAVREVQGVLDRLDGAWAGGR